MQQISARHGATGEEMCAHPSLFEVVWRRLVAEDVHKELPPRPQSRSYLCHQELIVFHVLEQFDRNNSIK